MTSVGNIKSLYSQQFQLGTMANLLQVLDFSVVNVTFVAYSSLVMKDLYQNVMLA